MSHSRLAKILSFTTNIEDVIRVIRAHTNRTISHTDEKTTMNH